MSAEGFVFDWPPAVLPIVGDDRRFKLRRVFCVGRNYAEHAREMGHDPDREPPFFFMKPADAVVAEPDTVPYPPATTDLHHEVELAVMLGADLRAATPAEASDAVWGHAVAVDLTRRDLQGEAKKLGRPWEVGKAFEAACPCAAVRRGPPPTAGAIRLSVNGKRRQDGDLAQLIWSVPEVLAQASRVFTLKPGDIVLTGTPAGVGPLRPGDRVVAGIEGVGELRFEIVGESSSEHGSHTLFRI
jgi:fumarylpyruvate hydrolase